MFFLLNRFLVFSLSLRRSQMKNLCFPKLLDLHIQVKRGEAYVFPINILYAFLLLNFEEPQE